MFDWFKGYVWEDVAPSNRSPSIPALIWVMLEMRWWDLDMVTQTLLAVSYTSRRVVMNTLHLNAAFRLAFVAASFPPRGRAVPAKKHNSRLNRVGGGM